MGELTPYVSAALGAYGGAVLAKTQDQAADATVSWGKRILQRVFGVAETADECPSSIKGVLDNPEDADSLTTLRADIHQVLAEDPDLAKEVAEMLQRAKQEAAVTSSVTVVANSYDHAQQAVLGEGTQHNTFNAK
ncbi:hypothetical protein ACFQYP_44305 [Nonomuraea antimicrobica]